MKRFGAVAVAALVGALLWLLPQVLPDVDLETSQLPREGGFEIAGGRRGRATVMIDWTPSSRGMLFAVDSRASSPLGGAVWLIDPETEAVIGEISTGSNPEAVLSPDGTRIFVLSRSVTSDGKPVEVVSAIFLGTGEVAWETEAIWPDQVRRRSASAIALSGNGGTVYVTALGRALDDPASPRLVAINAFSGDRVASFSAPKDCGRQSPKLASGPSLSTVLVMCEQLATVHYVDIEAEGPGISKEIDWSAQERASSLSIVTDQTNERVFIMQSDAKITELNATQVEFVRRLDLGLGIRSIQSVARSGGAVIGDGAMLATPVDNRRECSVSTLDQPTDGGIDGEPASCEIVLVDLADGTPTAVRLDRPVSAIAGDPQGDGFLVVDGQSGEIAQFALDGTLESTIDVGISLTGILTAN